MKIAILASSKNIIPSRKTGGIEQSVFYLVKELAKRGHKISLYAAPGSKIKGVKLKKISPFPTFVKLKYANLQERITSFYDLNSLAEFFHSGQADRFDLILYTNYIFYEIMPFVRWTKTPILIQINYPHTEVYPYLKSELLNSKNVYYLPVSNFIKKSMPDLSYLESINPVFSFEDFPFSPNGGDYLLSIGRICFDKGVDIAVKVARMAGKKLIIAGGVNEANSDFFNEYIKPFVDNKKIIYVGEVDFKTKIKLFKKALATLFPIRWDEPFGIVMLESMACGTPVIAFDRAAVREVMKDNVTGIIVKDGDMKAMARAVKGISEIDRNEVRRFAEKNFSIEIWAEKFENICQDIVRKSVPGLKRLA